MLGITSNEDHTREMVLNSLGIVTILKPALGYSSAPKSRAKDIGRGNRSIRLLSARDSSLLKRSGTSCFRLRA